MFLTEIKNVGKPDVEIDVKYSERDRTVRYGLWPYLPYLIQRTRGVQREQQENQGGVTGVNKNCVDKIMDFLENTLKLKIQNPYR